MDKKQIRVVFFGSSRFAAEVLLDLAEKNVKLLKVITQPDRVAGRKHDIMPTPVKSAAQKLGLPISQFEQLDKSAIDELEALEFDLGIVAAYGLIIPQAVLKIPASGFINVHPSILPKYRGPSPIQSVLLAGENITGTTIMLMDEGIDSGPILSQKKIKVLPDEDYYALEDKLVNVSNQLLFETIDSYLKEKIIPRDQKDEEATFTKMIKKEDGLIDWRKNAIVIYNAYRAYKNWPKVYSFYLDKGSWKKIILERISLGNGLGSNQPGKIAKINGQIIVGTATDPLVLEEVTLEGSKTLNANEFILGRPEFIGSTLSSKKS